MIYFLTQSTKHLEKSVLKSGSVGKWQKGHFADGEDSFKLKTKVKGKSVTLVASVTAEAESLFEFLALHQLLKENGAKEIRVVVPYLAYARQDRPTAVGEGSIGVLVSRLVKMVDSPISILDVHADKIRHALGKFTELTALSLIAENTEVPDVIVSPDKGAKSRAQALVKYYAPHPKVAVISKTRPKPNEARADSLAGNVKGKSCLIVDDMIDTGGTIEAAVRLLKRKGAKSISVAATHGIFSKSARARLARLPIEKIYVTNSLPQKKYKKIKILDVTSLILS